MRTILKVYSYMCDRCGGVEDITTGDAIPAYVGALYPNLAGNVRTADDADLVIHRRCGWEIGNQGTYHLCDECKEK